MGQLFLVIPNQAKVTIKSLNGNASIESILSFISINALNSEQSIISIQLFEDAVISKSAIPNSMTGGDVAATDFVIRIYIPFLVDMEITIFTPPR